MWDIKNKVVLITGATSGIGKETALALAKMGAQVVVHGRNLAKTKQVVDEIRQASGNEKVTFIMADFSSLSAVKKLAVEFKERFDRLDVLINNAGGYFDEEILTPEGHEMTFQVNFLAHFLLTELLSDLLKKSAPARVIHVSSMAHQLMSRMDFSKLDTKGGYRGFFAYRAVKVCVIWFSNLLAENLKKFGVTSNSLHPGVVRTGFGKNNSSFMKVIWGLIGAFALNPVQGAQTTIYAATAPELEGVTGQYFDKSSISKATKLASDPELARKFWDESMKKIKPWLGA